MAPANPYLIGIGHTARVGKDTFAWFLIDALRASGIDARRYAFADALKAVCRVEYAMRGKDAVLLQMVGVEYRKGVRAYSSEEPPYPTPDVWLNAVRDQIIEERPQVAVIPDMRFRNEFDWIAANGFTVRLTRAARPATGRDDAHISEVELVSAPFDFTIANDGSLATLKHEATFLASRLSRELKGRPDATL